MLPKEGDVDSRAGFPYGAAEIFSLMQQMGCDPDRASYNIMLDAYGRAGLHKGTLLSSSLKFIFISKEKKSTSRII